MSEDLTRLFGQMMAQGQEMVRAFNPALAEGPAAEGGQDLRLDRLFPTMSKDMMEAWFGRTFNRDGLDARTRLLATLAALVAQGAQGDAQIRLTVRHALAAGASRREIAEVISQTGMFGGVPAMTRALELAQGVFDETQEDSE